MAKPDIAQLVKAAIRLDNDVNGNGRYYLSIVSFVDDSGQFYRPKYCVKYRGKRFGAGWVFQSCALADDLRRATEGF